jgi:hypothetical protein
MRRLLAVLCAGGALAAAAPVPLAGQGRGPLSGLTTAPPALDEHALAHAAFGNDAPWYEGNIPFFETADAQLTKIYYYRWQVYRAHQRDLGPRGYITTEFLDDVGWQRQPYASLNDASGFHIAEGRWLRDRRYVGDYVDFLYAGGGNDRHFSEGIADAVWGRYLVEGDRAGAVRHLDAMQHIYTLWDDHFDFTKRLYWIEPLLDATEYTIASIDSSGGKDGFTGGEAFRPSINSYMFGNARAISHIAALQGDAATAATYAARADDLRAHVEQDLWSAPLTHFIDRYRVNNDHVKYWDRIRGRELVGYLPWTVGLPRDTAASAAAWKHLLSPIELGGTAGLRTVEPSYQYYLRQYRYDKDTGRRECQWNGPAWPFQTTQALVGMANLLEDYHQSVVTRSDYMRLLRQYADLHATGATPDLQEDYDPDTGAPIVGLARSHHYNHSGFVDLIISGMVGIRPRADDVLEVDPLVPHDPSAPGFQRWFALQDVPYHGRRVSVVFDADGSHYHRGAGLSVLVDGRMVAHAVGLGRVTVPLLRKALPPVARPADLAMNLVATDFPTASASINADPVSLHQALDGRVWFFPEMVNGWSTTGASGREQWFAVDFGRTTRVQSAELAFFGDGKAIAAPLAYRLQAWRAGSWQDLPAVAPRAVENGITRLSWPTTATTKVRIVLRNTPGTAARLVEFKVF